MDERVCKLCDGTGWVTIRKGDRELAQKCGCRLEDTIITRSEKFNIPKRFMGVSLEDYYPDKRNPSQGEAKQIVTSFISDYPAIYSGILFEGTTGVGKTRLLCTIASELIKKMRTIDMYYIDWNDLVREMRSGDHLVTRDYSSVNQMVSRLATVDLLLFDELGSAGTTPWILDNIYYIFNRRYNEQKLTICATNYLDKSINNQETLTQRVGERIRSRLYEMTQVVEIRGDDLRQH